MSKDNKKLILIDGNALLHRAFHAIRPLMDSKGRQVNALYGFAKILTKLLKEIAPQYTAVCWDRREKTFRHDAYAEYKANREAKPQDLYDQIDMIKELLSLYGIPSYDLKGFEADDLLGTIAKKMKLKVDKVLILTGDMDALQLVDEKINVIAFVKGVSEIIRYDIAEVKAKYGFLPEQLIDYKALMGDPSDNIKGVNGIGKKGAEQLIVKYGSVENIYKNIEKLEVSDRVYEILKAGKDDAFQSKELVTIVKDAPLKFSLSDMEFGKYDKTALLKFYLEYGFRSLTSGKKLEAGSMEHEVSINNKEDLKVALKNIDEQFVFYIKEAQEGLFGKEVAELSFCSGGLYVNLTQSKGLKPTDALPELKQLLENQKIKKVSHDLKSQMHILSRFGIDLRGVAFDTMLAAYVLKPGQRRYEIEEILLDYLNSKPSANTAKDILSLQKVLNKKIEEEKLTQVFFEIEMPLILVLFSMEQAGIRLDKKLLEGLNKDFSKRLEKIDKKIHKLAGEEFNIDSPQQLKVILYEKLELKPESGRIKKGKTGLSTAASELEKLSELHPIIDLISEHRELAKLMNTYVEALPRLVAYDGRVHSTFNQIITATGRLSSSNPNMQNIPTRTEIGKKIRQAFVAEAGKSLIALDYSQFELRLAAVISGEEHMIKAFNKGVDIHKQTAAEIFGLDLDNVTPEMRHKAKAVNFGVLYGMGVTGLARATKMTRGEAEDFLSKYTSTHPKIMEYVETTKALAYKRGYVETLFGRRRYLPELNSYMEAVRASGERMAINMPIQGTQADLIKMAMIKVFNDICSNEIKMILQVHDELVFEVPESQAKKIAEKIKEIMEGIYKFQVSLEVDVEISERWG